MSIPKISPLTKMDAIQKNAYISHKIKEFVSLDEDSFDEKLTKYNIEAMRIVNDYLEQSQELLYAMLVLNCLLKDSNDKLEQSNIYDLIKSLSSQMRLSKAIKRNLKHIGINKDWYHLFVLNNERLLQRVNFVKHIAIKNIAETTELDIYMKELEVREISFIEDMKAYFGDGRNLNEIMDSEDWKEQIKDYIAYIKGSVERNIVSPEFREEYLKRKAIRQEFLQRKLDKTNCEREEQKKQAYKEMCDILERDIGFMRKRFINAYRHDKKTSKMQRALHLLTEYETIAVIICKRQFSDGFGREMYITKYKNEIVLTENIDRLAFIPCDEVNELETRLQQKNIAYAVCFLSYSDVCSIMREIQMKKDLF